MLTCTVDHTRESGAGATIRTSDEDMFVSFARTTRVYADPNTTRNRRVMMKTATTLFGLERASTMSDVSKRQYNSIYDDE